MDYKNLSSDMKRRLREVQRVIERDAPAYFAVAWERMKDANFAAQGFVVRGSASPRWAPRKKETPRTAGKRILFGTGTLQNSVHFTPGKGQVRAWVDLGQVPYAKVHNEGGKVLQNVRPHHRTSRNGKRYQVRGFTRKVVFPQRKYLDYSPDIEKSASKDLTAALNKIFK